MAAQLPVLSLFSGAGCLDLAVERCAEPFGANGARTEGPFTVAAATDYDAPNDEGLPRERRLSNAELLRLMSLPDGILVEGDGATIRRQLEDAVPVELGKAVVGALAEQLGMLSRPAELRVDLDAVLAAGLSRATA